MNILLVEDNLTIIKGLKYSFEKNNYNLIFKNNISDAKKSVDLIIIVIDGSKRIRQDDVEFVNHVKVTENINE